ncbi:MAG: heparinase II/III family protein [Clostridia bacterium]|nr:heparinase II/III family protein [Clostridia bacterium]
MKKYCASDIYDILESVGNIDIAYGEAERERVLSNPLLAQKLKMLKEAGGALRGTPICELRFSAFKRFETDGNRTEYESSPDDGYFIRRRKLVVFSILSWLYDNKEDIEYLEDILWAICSEYTWCLPAHLRGTGLSEVQTDGTFTVDLFASETASGIAETLSLVGNMLSPVVRKRCEHELSRRVLDRCTDKVSWNTVGSNNWVCVCNGGCGIAAMYCEKDLSRLSAILESCINGITNYTKSITSDGACSEGLGYWGYGFGYYLYFAEMLYRRTDGRINILDDEKIKKTASFFCNCTFPRGQYVSFADMWGKTIFYALPGLLSKTKELFPEVSLVGKELMDFSFPDILRMRFTRELREFVWVAHDLENEISHRYGTHIYPDAQIMISTSENGVSIAAKGGHNNEEHNHNDVGSFMLVKNGVRILDDIGASEYVNGYFGEKRYEFFAPSSLSHNLPVICGRGQKGGEEHRAENVVITENGLQCEMSKAYGIPILNSLVRKIDFDAKSGKTVICDTFSFSEKPESLCERFVTPHKPKLCNGKIVFGTEEEHMTLSYDSDIFEVSLSDVTDIRHDICAERTTYVVELVAKRVTTEEKFEITVE